MPIETYLLEQLSAFRRAGTLSGAAETLHISQPALSRSMQKLEKELQVPLFLHGRNRLHLTETGKIAADYADRILQMQNEMVSLLQSYERSLKTIAIGSCAPGPLLMPVAFAQSFPGKTITTELNASEQELIGSLKKEALHLIFLSHPYSDELTESRFWSDEHLFISVIPAHPAAVYSNQGVSFRDMDGETFLMNRSIGLWNAIVHQYLPHSRFVLQTDMEALETVVNTSTLPSFATDLANRLYQNRFRNRVLVPITDESACMSFYAVYLKKNRKKLSPWLLNETTEPAKKGATKGPKKK